MSKHAKNEKSIFIAFFSRKSILTQVIPPAPPQPGAREDDSSHGGMLRPRNQVQPHTGEEESTGASGWGGG